MGLTNASIKKSNLTDLSPIKKSSKDDYIVALAGNPNTGKSTVFNALTGLHQHTGNWPGKTVVNAQGQFKYRNKNFILVDLPGTYSLQASSVEEQVARDFLCSPVPDACIIVMDATCIERNLNLTLQILEITDNVLICVNLMDEAKKKNICIDIPLFSNILGVPVIGTSSRNGEGISELKDTLFDLCNNTIFSRPYKVKYDKSPKDDLRDAIVSQIYEDAEKITSSCVKTTSDPFIRDKKIDDILTSKKFGIPIMLLLLSLILWITIEGANIPSAYLAKFLFYIQSKLTVLFDFLGAPNWVYGILILGLYRTLAWVVSVMLPPMAIFFPIFTLLEDLGYLPRICFNLDHVFKKACAHGKQCLTMCMGLGCNAAGVISSRIIESPRERLIAILTNNFVPCNGRFPTLIIMASILCGLSFFSSFIVVALVVLGICITLLVSYLLSKTLLKGLPSSFTLELPPYRKPQIGKIIYTSLIDRTIFVLSRAAIVAAPAGAITYILSNIYIGNFSIVGHVANFLNPFAQLFGLDGFILLAFILGFPANEIVLPILVMSYLSKSSMVDIAGASMLKNVLVSNGWTYLTIINFMLMCLMHSPCATTVWTIRKETGSIKWTIWSIFIPTFTGLCTCFLTTQIYRLFCYLYVL